MLQSLVFLLNKPSEFSFAPVASLSLPHQLKIFPKTTSIPWKKIKIKRNVSHQRLTTCWNEKSRKSWNSAEKNKASQRSNRWKMFVVNRKFEIFRKIVLLSFEHYKKPKSISANLQKGKMKYDVFCYEILIHPHLWCLRKAQHNNKIRLNAAINSTLSIWFWGRWEELRGN